MPRIAICAPARPITPDDAARVETIAAEFPGLDLHFHDQCFAEAGHFAGDDDLRVAAFLDCANDSSFDAVWFARGGYGSNRIAARAVAGLGEAAGTKTWLGYSDLGYLLGALYKAGIGNAVHGPLAVDVRREGGDAAIRRALGYLAGDAAGLEPSLDGTPTAAFNLATLAMLCGTELMPDLADHVVMVEDVSEHHYAIDRLFFHVTQNLPRIAGLRLGRIAEVPENEVPFGATPEEIARDWCGRAGIAFLGHADIGHDAANKIVPFGVAGAHTGS
jgi:muramoyltetrapeptide carboxypeptidase